MSKGVLEKLRIRQCKSVKLPNGETVHIRTMSIGEHSRALKIPKDQQMGFLVGSVLVNDDGSPAYPRNENESDSEFAQRILDTTEIDVPGMNAVIAAHTALEKTPSQDVLAKNSETTGTQT